MLMPLFALRSFFKGPSWLCEIWTSHCQPFTQPVYRPCNESVSRIDYGSSSARQYEMKLTKHNGDKAHKTCTYIVVASFICAQSKNDECNTINGNSQQLVVCASGMHKQ